MEPTEKLYFADSSALEFTATVIDVKPTERGDKVVLSSTAFYPTGGGQPNDTGKLDGATVIDVFEDHHGVIHHIVEETGLINAGHTVAGHIDRHRRLDHLQQHSGQHILSQAFVEACNAETRSFHLGAETSTIDIELASPTEDHMRAAEEVANRIIFEDRPLHVHLLTDEEAARLPLRKESAVTGTIRVIEIEDFDFSPCGGTHAERTGQIGLIAIKRFERAKRMTRVEFVCGHRALEEFRRANSTAVAVAKLFSAERDSTPELVAKTIQESKSLKKRIRDLLDVTTAVEAAEMLEQARAYEKFKIVERVYEGRDLDEIRLLASKIVQSTDTIALLGTKDAGAARLVFARSPSLAHNMGELLAESSKLLGGRGGGKPELAQGGGPELGKLDEAIKLAAEKIIRDETRK